MDNPFAFEGNEDLFESASSSDSAPRHGRPPILNQIDPAPAPPPSPKALVPHSHSHSHSRFHWSYAWFLQLDRKDQILTGTGIIVAIAALTLIIGNVLHPSQGGQVQTEIPGINAPVEVNTAQTDDRLVQDFQQADDNAQAQTQIAQEHLLKLIAYRMQNEAQKQVTTVGMPCYRLSLQCVYDQFEQDAFRQMEAARQSQEATTFLAALDRIAAVDYAREGVGLQEPQWQTTLELYRTRLKARQDLRTTSEEAIYSTGQSNRSTDEP